MAISEFRPDSAAFARINRSAKNAFFARRRPESSRRFYTMPAPFRNGLGIANENLIYQFSCVNHADGTIQGWFVDSR
ncbi:hypothetical protein CA54_11530 [Symmachiella macrocystis]|uniref:Uncharacterized protein n=1 Tax=Symmachiella macrocystis TaxID=2527985 RepID=A0A5C6BJW6_9PLAN|nr:hypothetical protein CA54_11530 [Symmachiella macrocystis]